jgi:DNA polymerase-4
MGRRLGHFARGEDARQIVADEATKSISAETTFAKDLRTREDIAHALVPLCERVAERLQKAALAASGVALKLKTADFKLRSRSRALAAPTQLADTLTRAALALLDREIDGTAFRLVGIGAERLAESHLADPPDLFDGTSQRAGRIEDAVATIRARLGHDAIGRGGALVAKPGRSRDVDEDGGISED